MRKKSSAVRPMIAFGNLATAAAMSANKDASQDQLGKRRKARRNCYESLKMGQEMDVAGSTVATLVNVAELEMSYGRFEQATELVGYAIQQEFASIRKVHGKKLFSAKA